MGFCRNCGTKVLENGKYCHNCGTKQASVRSKPGKPSSPWDPPRAVNSNPTLTSYLEWSDPCSLPELNPILDNPNYLREQHILIAVKSEAGDESYGECVLSLKGHLFNTPQNFESGLTHGGVKAGEIRGRMNVLHAKQAALRKQPVVHAKPDMGAKNPSFNRPYSCIATNVSENIPASRMKSASLGRQPSPVGRKSSGHDVNRSTYITLPDLSSVIASNNPCDEMTATESSAPPPLPAKNSCDEMTATETSAPPPLPAKMYPSKASTLPSTVNELLSKIGLERYLSNLVDNGFEDLTFLDNISDEDLADSGITDSDHMKKILNEVDLLRKAGAFSS